MATRKAIEWSSHLLHEQIEGRHHSKEFSGVSASHAEPWPGNQTDVLSEVVFEGGSNREQIAIPFSNTCLFAIHADPWSPRKVRRIDRLESDIEREDHVPCGCVFSPDGDGGHRSRLNTTNGVESSTIGIESTHRL